MRRPARFDGADDSDVDEEEYERGEADWVAGQNLALDADMHNWFEGSLGSVMTVRNAIAAGPSDITDLSRRLSASGSRQGRANPQSRPGLSRDRNRVSIHGCSDVLNRPTIYDAVL